MSCLKHNRATLLPDCKAVVVGPVYVAENTVLWVPEPIGVAEMLAKLPAAKIGKVGKLLLETIAVAVVV